MWPLPPRQSGAAFQTEEVADENRSIIWTLVKQVPPQLLCTFQHSPCNTPSQHPPFNTHLSTPTSQHPLQHSTSCTLHLMHTPPHAHSTSCTLHLMHSSSPAQVRPGMDLSKVALPTFILEPRSFLDKLSDYYYHADLLSE